MSQLDSIIEKLNKSLKDSPVPISAKAETQNPDPQKSSSQLKEFLSKNAVELQLASKGTQEDPQHVLSRRKAVSEFVGINLQNDGKAILSGTIEPGAAGKQAVHGHNTGHSAAHRGGHGSAPGSSTAQHTCLKCQAREAEDLRKLVESELKPASADAPSAQPAKESSSSKGNGNGNGNGNGHSHSAETEQSEKSKSKTGVAAFFAAALGGSAAQPAGQAQASGNSTAAPASSSKPTAAASTLAPVSGLVAAPAAAMANTAIIWFKHIQAVESALRIQDLHFAESLLSLLQEAAASLSAQTKISVRLKSLQARVLMERKMHAEAEALLLETLKSIEGTANSKDVSAAYCCRALAQCYHYQNKPDKAVKWKEKSIAIATAALGANDPEAMLFKDPLAS